MKKKCGIPYFNQAFFPAYIGAAFSEVDYLQEMKRLNVDDPNPYMPSKSANVKTLFREGYVTCIICFDPKKKVKIERNMIVALLAHEAVHVTDIVFRHVGEDNPGDETRAYFVQAILQDVLYALDDYLKGTKK